MPFSHLILCHLLLLLPPIPPSIRVFSNESALNMRWPKYWSFSFSIILQRTPRIDLFYFFILFFFSIMILIWKVINKPIVFTLETLKVRVTNKSNTVVWTTGKAGCEIDRNSLKLLQVICRFKSILKFFFFLEWTGWISLQYKGLSRVFSNTTVQKHQFFGAQLSSHPTFTSIHDYWKNHSLD